MMKQRECLRKKCPHLKKRTEHEYWKQRELKKKRKRGKNMNAEKSLIIDLENDRLTHIGISRTDEDKAEMEKAGFKELLGERIRVGSETFWFMGR